jgi:uridylate kinase
MTAQVLKYRRVLLKYSGEVLQGRGSNGVEPYALDFVVSQIKQLQELGVEVGIVIGGGNFFRGKNLLSSGFDQAKADKMGMLATVMNAIALQHALTAEGTRATVFSAVPMPGFVQTYEIEVVREAIASGQVVICAGGTGHPFFTTDTAACLRAIELQAEMVLKATKVDGIYSKDPKQHADAKRFDFLTYEQAIEQKLGVMDTTAICLCQQHQLPIQVFNMHNENALKAIVLGEQIGTIVGVKHVTRA